MEELQRQLIAVQLIQELIVDILDEKGVIGRKEFENKLAIRVKDFNKKIQKMQEDVITTEDINTNAFYYFNPAPGEA